MKKIAIILMVIVYACNVQHPDEVKEKSKAEILQAEKDFEKAVAENGAARAFMDYADRDAVINRNNNLIHGPDSIFSF